MLQNDDSSLQPTANAKDHETRNRSSAHLAQTPVKVCSCTVVYGGVRWCAVVHGGVWWCMVVYGGVRWCAVLNGGVWWCMVVYGGVRWCAVVHGGVWWCMVVCGRTWWCMVVYGGVRWCAVVHGGAWWCANPVCNVDALRTLFLSPPLARRPRARLVCTRGHASVDTFYAPAALYDNHIFGTGNVGRCQCKLNDTTVMDSVMT